MAASTERVPGEGGASLGGGAVRALSSRNASSSRSSLGRRRRDSLLAARHARRGLGARSAGELCAPLMQLTRGKPGSLSQSTKAVMTVTIRESY